MRESCQCRDTDMDINPTKEKKLTNVRSVMADEKTNIAPPRVNTLEDAIGYVAADELIEVTPSAVRMRKLILECNKRQILQRHSKG